MDPYKLGVYLTIVYVKGVKYCSSREFSKAWSSRLHSKKMELWKWGSGIMRFNLFNLNFNMRLGQVDESR